VALSLGVLLVELSSVVVMASAQRWPFFTARRSHSGARVQS